MRCRAKKVTPDEAELRMMPNNETELSDDETLQVIE